jgi:tRNA threonylcarbamoyladenosine biosynthesis protein TsaE
MSIFNDLRAGVATASAEETRGLAARFAAALPPDATLALHGDLGVGKTTFVQGLARGFGLSARVTSPTFNILHLYRNAPALHRAGGGGADSPRRRDGGSGGGRPDAQALTLVHLDAYRLENPRQVAGLMLDDFLTSPYCLAVEWPDRIAGWLPAETLHLTLSIESPDRRRVTLDRPA